MVAQILEEDSHLKEWKRKEIEGEGALYIVI